MRASLGLQQSQQLQQRLVMTPKLQQAIKVMQMTSLELQQHVELELQENILLEEGLDLELEDEILQEMKELDSSDLETTEEDAFPEIRVEDFLDDSLPPLRHDYSTDEEQDNEDRRVEYAEETSFLDHLFEQLSMLRLPQADREVCRLILSNLTDDGFLVITLDELVEETGRDADDVEEILRYAQTRLEPIGIASRDRREYFLLQIAAMENADEIAARLVRDHYDDLLKNRIPKIAKDLRAAGVDDATPDRVQEAKKWLANLQLTPASGFLEGFHGVVRYGRDARPIIPDVIVETENDEYIVRAVDDSLPRLHLNRRYLELLSNPNKLTTDERKWLEDYRQRAKELIESITERGKTIENVAREIFEVQSEFLEHGVRRLKPLVLRDIAERLGKHESTISRATSGKYVQTPRGIFELKFFFSSGLESETGQMTSSTSVRAEIEEIISAEDPAKPLSDQKLSQILKARGTKVARRTVAKYREELAIPPSSQRKSQWK